MNNGTITYDGNVLEVFEQASTILYDAVSHTLGAYGLNTAIPTSNGYLSIINDGKTILERLSSEDPAIRLALNTLKESAFATNMRAGDGTTSTTILQHQLLTGSLITNRAVRAGDLDEELLIDSTYLNRARDFLLDKLQDYKKEIKSDEDLLKVITVSLGSDKLANVVLEAFKGLNKGQTPTLVKDNSIKETCTTVIDGINLSPIEVNPVVLREMPNSLTEPLNVVILHQTISRLDNQFTMLLEKIARSNKKTILLYTEIMPSVMDQLLFNIQEGSLNLVPIRLALPMTKMDDYITELGKYFNVEPFTDLNPYQTITKDTKLFGEASGYILNKDSVIIKADNPEYESELLPSKSTLISVGFVTYSQQEEDYRRLEDAINSAANALTYGYTIGAGYTLLCLAQSLEGEFDRPSITDALSYIFYKVAYSMEKEYPNEQDFITYCMDNVYDSYKVTEQVILNAFTVVAQVLSTHRLLVPLSRSLLGNSNK